MPKEEKRSSEEKSFNGEKISNGEKNLMGQKMIEQFFQPGELIGKKYILGKKSNGAKNNRTVFQPGDCLI